MRPLRCPRRSNFLARPTPAWCRMLCWIRWCKGGVNRLSLGAQSTNAQELAALGRQHTWPQVADAVQRARRAGIKNLNIDLMMGLPGQTMATFDDTLSAVLALAPAHISCYGLIVEEGTPLAASIQAGALTLPPEDEERALVRPGAGSAV
jgi:oxygen-independent coproporphyrinogen-3 oxidase